MSTVERLAAAAGAPEMRVGGGLTRRMLLASGLLMVVVGAAFTVLLFAIADLRESGQQTRETRDELIALDAVEKLVVDLETGLRGFVITGERRFLDPWNDARAAFPERAGTLELLAADDPETRRRVAGIVAAVRSYIQDYSVPLVAAAERGEPSARTVARTEEGKRRIDALRAQLDTFRATERARITERQERADAASRRAVVAGAAGLGGSIVLVALFAVYLLRAIVRPVRRAAAMADRLAGGDLGTRMRTTGVGEIGVLERSFNVMAGSLERNRDELAELAAEQAALRRVATLVAQRGSPAEVFSAVAEEAAQRLGAEITKVLRYEPDGTVSILGGWSVPGMHIPIGIRLTVEDEGLSASVLRTERPARTDRFEGPPGSVGECFHDCGVRSGVASPIVVEGRLWGVLIAASSQPEPMASDAEASLAAFTELVATAIANAEARAELRRIADEQAALRRVATLVARDVAPEQVFAAVADEIAELLGADIASIVRFHPDGTATVVGVRGGGLELGTHFAVDPRFPIGRVRDTGRGARVDLDDPSASSLPDDVRLEGVRSSVASPVVVEGRTWGAVRLSSREALPRDIEQRLAGFTELVGTAVANAESGAELAASRARVVTASDETRRRIERDLHDGAQQRLVSIGLRLRSAAAAFPRDLDGIRDELARVGSELDDVLEDLRELSRGLHPAILAEGGLGPALRTLARRSSVPVVLDVATDGRLPEPIEVAAYFVVSEALANAAKHARASAVNVDVGVDGGVLRLSIRDDGVGGADPARGSGLIGLRDRVEAMGGTIGVDSPAGAGTSLTVELPTAPPSG